MKRLLCFGSARPLPLLSWTAPLTPYCPFKGSKFIHRLFISPTAIQLAIRLVSLQHTTIGSKNLDKHHQRRNPIHIRALLSNLSLQLHKEIIVTKEHSKDTGEL